MVSALKNALNNFTLEVRNIQRYETRGNRNRWMKVRDDENFQPRKRYKVQIRLQNNNDCDLRTKHQMSCRYPTADMTFYSNSSYQSSSATHQQLSPGSEAITPAGGYFQDFTYYFKVSAVFQRSSADFYIRLIITAMEKTESLS